MADTEAKGGDNIPDNAQDLTIFVQNLLEQMVSLFLLFSFSSLFSFALCLTIPGISLSHHSNLVSIKCQLLSLDVLMKWAIVSTTWRSPFLT